MGGQLGNHPPCVATGAVPQGPSGQEPHLQSIRIANTANPVSKSGARSSWFQFLGGRGCAEIRAKPLLGLFLFPCLVAL